MREGEDINGVTKKDRDRQSRLLSDIHGAKKWNETDYAWQLRRDKAAQELGKEI